MYLSNDNIYVHKNGKYIECTLRKTILGDYYLEQTKTILDRLPENWSVVTFEEIVALLGHAAMHDHAVTRGRNYNG